MLWFGGGGKGGMLISESFRVGREGWLACGGDYLLVLGNLKSLMHETVQRNEVGFM